MLRIKRQVFLLLCLLQCQILFAAPITGKVVGVSDGDTIKVLDSSKTQHIIRLAGIDAPEKAQPFGQRSKEHLSDLVFGKQVTIEGDKIDRYQRRVGKVIVAGVDANLEQIKSGFAWHYKAYEKEQPVEDRASYSSAEQASRTKHIGLWSDKSPTPPWEWRHDGMPKVSAQNTNTECPCGGASHCTGSRGGQFCYAPNGKKKY